LYGGLFLSGWPSIFWYLHVKAWGSLPAAPPPQLRLGGGGGGYYKSGAPTYPIVVSFYSPDLGHLILRGPDFELLYLEGVEWLFR